MQFVGSWACNSWARGRVMRGLVGVQCVGSWAYHAWARGCVMPALSPSDLLAYLEDGESRKEEKEHDGREGAAALPALGEEIPKVWQEVADHTDREGRRLE